MPQGDIAKACQYPDQEATLFKRDHRQAPWRRCSPAPRRPGLSADLLFDTTTPSSPILMAKKTYPPLSVDIAACRKSLPMSGVAFLVIILLAPLGRGEDAAKDPK